MNQAALHHRRTDAMPSNQDADEFVSLPGWIYRDPEFFASETERVLRTAWQVVCHLNDIAQTGDYYTFDISGRVDLRRCAATTAWLRGFHNVCRHQGGADIGWPGGHCRRAAASVPIMPGATICAAALSECHSARAFPASTRQARAGTARD